MSLKIKDSTKMSDIKNNFSWSKSRDGVFKECPRKYYFNHYGFWGGWEMNAPDKIRELYILKNIITKEMWIGQVVHDIIKKVLLQRKKGDELSLGQALTILEKRLNKDFNDSKSKIYREYPKRTALFEHVYDMLIPKDKWDKLFRKAEKCITNFYNSNVYQKIKNTPTNQWVLLEDFLDFNFENTKIFLRIDFAVKENEKITLYDWKTGKDRNKDMKVQLACYALYALNEWDIEPKDITIKKYNVAMDKEKESEIDHNTIENIKEYIRTSIKEMKNLLEDKEDNIAKKEDFPMNKSSSCSWCKFKKICLANKD